MKLISDLVGYKVIEENMNPEVEYDIGNKDVGILLKPATPSVIRRGLCVLKYEGGFSLYLYLLIVMARSAI